MGMGSKTREGDKRRSISDSGQEVGVAMKMEECFTFHGDSTRAKHHGLEMKNVAVIGDDARHNWHASLNGKMERALLERQQDRVLGVAAGSFREHVDALALHLNLPGGSSHGVPRILGVLAIDKDGTAQAHKPSQEGNLLEIRFGSDAAPLGEQGAEHEDVQLRLVIANEDGRPNGAEYIARVVNLEDNARRQSHGVVERAGGNPLRNTLLANEGEEHGGDDTKDGTHEQRHI